MMFLRFCVVLVVSLLSPSLSSCMQVPPSPSFTRYPLMLTTAQLKKLDRLLRSVLTARPYSEKIIQLLAAAGGPGADGSDLIAMLDAYGKVSAQPADTAGEAAHGDGGPEDTVATHDIYCDFLLYKAMLFGDSAVVRLLLEILKVHAPAHISQLMNTYFPYARSKLGGIDEPMHGPLLHLAVQRSDDVDWASGLIGMGAPLDGRDAAGWTPLHWALYTTHMVVAGHLVQRYEARCPALWTAILDAQDSWGRTPLHYAVTDGNECAVKFLLFRGAQVSLPDREGKTPLHLAIRYHKIDMAGLLMKFEANTGVSDAQGQTPLHYAALQGDKDAVTALLLGGEPSVDVQDFRGRTPLHSAVIGLFDEIVRLLVAHGARSDLRDRQEQTPLELARHLGDETIIQILGPIGLRGDGPAGEPDLELGLGRLTLIPLGQANVTAQLDPSPTYDEIVVSPNLQRALFRSGYRL